MNSVFVGDAGTEIILDTGSDISLATECGIRAVAPNGRVKVWPGQVDGTTRVKHVIQAGELDIAGTWAIQAYVEIPGWSGRGAFADLVVLK